MSFSVRLASASLAGVCAATVAWQAVAPASAAQQPGDFQRFLSRADVVVVDVSVLDRARQPVRDLTASDFTIVEDGRPQAVEYFRHIDLPEPPVPPATWMRDVAPDLARNEEISERRLVVILMDDAMIPFDVQMTSSARQIARDVVDRLGPKDLAAVVFTRDNRRTQNFTRDRARLLASIDAFESGGYEPVPGGERSPQPFFLDAMHTLFRAVESLAAIPERRKAVVYISTGIPLLIDTPDVSRTDHPYLNWLARQMLTRAQRSGVNIYTVDPGGLDGIRGYMLRRNRRPETFIIEQIERSPTFYRDFLQSIADNTGGRAFINTNEFTSRIGQIFRETGSFYLLGYRSPNPRADGRFRRLQVRVNRSGVTVNARRGYYAPPPPELAARMGAPPNTDTALAGLVPKTDLPLELITLPIAVPGRSEAAVILTVGLRAPAARGDTPIAGDAVDLLLRAFTPEGDDRGSTRLAVKVAPDQSLSGEVGYEVLGRLDLRPGRYELRASAASEAWAESGSVYGYLDVPDFAREPVSLSGVAIGVTPARIAGNAPVIADLLPFVPTTQRTFTRSDGVTAYVRVYQGGSSAPAAVSLAARVVDGHDRLVADMPATLSAGRFAASRSHDFQYEIQAASLAAGPHLLTIEVSIGRHRARRDVRFEIQ